MKRFFLALLLASTATAFGEGGATFDETARFLAGMPVGGALEPLTHTAAWQEHAAAMDQAWAKKETLQIAPISSWMASNAPEAYHHTGTMFYMFSGPDFLYANLFFPRASTYILAGLEPIGSVPDQAKISPDMLGPELSALRSSMSTILRFQYFITKDMRAELGRGSVSGTLPILYVFLARLGYTVIDATHVSSPAEGVKIRFASGMGGERELYYFKTDLSAGNSGFLRWCAARGSGVSLLKAASYLMHGEGFGAVRNFLLEHSRVIVQDDSGIPLRAFPKSWRIDYYGRYVPHPEFQKYWQPDLAALYERNPPPELGFPFGYHWQRERGILMVATREGAPRAIPVPPAKDAGTARPKNSRRSPAGPRSGAKKE